MVGDDLISFCNCDAKNQSCQCGEEHDVDWSWDNQYVNRQILLSNGDREVRFHSEYSSGTAAVRGQTPFKRGYHYYWEIKMLTALYGTDVMVGVGTDKVQLGLSAFRFCSMLGQDAESWGYSYRGEVQHKGQFTKYGPRFGQGSIIGVHLDMCAGTMEFYHNRQPLGVAFSGLANLKLYPMVSSTAAKSAIRVTCANSYARNLQFDCLREIFKRADLSEELFSIPGLKAMIQDYWWMFPIVRGPKIGVCSNEESYECGEHRKHNNLKRKRGQWTRYVDPDNHIYRFRTALVLVIPSDWD